MSTKALRRLIRDLVVLESKVSASAEYMKKEAVRQDIQDLIAKKIKSGELSDQESLEAWFTAADMSLKALKMVPIEAYQTSPRKGKSR